MTMKQSTLDRVRVINKHFTNKVLIHIAGKNSGHFAILSHMGRKSGKVYKIPIIAEPTERGFIIALTYGKRVDWLDNVMAKGGCSLKWKNREYSLSDPFLIDKEVGLTAFPAPIRAGLKMMKIEHFLRLTAQDGK
jgi:hypothetical protein